MAADLTDYALAVPVNALNAYGFGSMRGAGSKPAARLKELRATRGGVIAAVETAGVTGRRLLLVLGALGGRVSAQQLAFQTAGADPDVIEAAIDRLTAADLVATRADGGLELTQATRSVLSPTTISLAEPQAATSEEVAAMCRTNGIDPRSPRKQDRIDALARAFADPTQAGRIRRELSTGALAMLDRIAAAAGVGVAKAAAVGVTPYTLRLLPSLALLRKSTIDPTLAAVAELHMRGIVGVAPWDEGLWIWREAWPLLERPFVVRWQEHSRPKVVPARDPGGRLPPIVSALDQALRTWDTTPPTVLKNDELRLAKTDVKATARMLGVDEDALDVASRLAISIGLLLRNVAGRSGRGRNVRIDEVWRGDPPLVQAWVALEPMQRWARLVAEWCSPRLVVDRQLMVNRHLLLWELLQLEAGSGYADVDAFASWFGDRHASLGDGDAVRACIRDLVALGVATEKPLALTALGRQVLTDPSGLDATDTVSTTAAVQADLTVIAPPDLHHELVVAIEEIADVESRGGASIYRLSPTRITRAAQAGRTADELLTMLAGLSSAPLPDPVTRLVNDAAARAGAVRLVAAPTVLIVNDPADLVTACSIKSLKLTKVSDTVAVTDVPIAQVRAALERKNLAPEMLGAGNAAAPPRSSTADAEAAAQRAAALRAAARGHAHELYEREAKAMDAHAKRLSDMSARLAVAGPLTLTRTALDRLEGAKRR